MKRGGDDDRWKTCPDRRKKAFALNTVEYKAAVRALSLRLRAEDEEKRATAEETARRKACRAVAAEVAAELSRMAQGTLGAQ